MKRKILLILLVSLALFTTACGKTNESKKEKTNKQDNKQEVKKEKKEENINVAGTYFIYAEETNSPAYNEYLTLRYADKSFDRQANYCAGIKHITGTYEVKKENGKILIDLEPSNENVTIQVEYKDDKIILDKEKYNNSNETNESISYFIRSCTNMNSPMIFNKGEGSQAEYIETVYGDASIGPN